MILKRPRAILSINEQIDWILEESPDSAMHFIESIEESFALLEKNPEMGRPLRPQNSRLLGVRIWRVADFAKFLIFYRPVEKGVEILDVIHGARDLPAIFEDLL